MSDSTNKARGRGPGKKPALTMAEHKRKQHQKAKAAGKIAVGVMVHPDDAPIVREVVRALDFERYPEKKARARKPPPPPFPKDWL